MGLRFAKVEGKVFKTQAKKKKKWGV